MLLKQFTFSKMFGKVIPIAGMAVVTLVTVYVTGKIVF